jgi:Fibronectin type III domain
MGKKLLFCFLIIGMQLFVTTSFAHEDRSQLKNSPVPNLVCEAAAPDSFRVVGYGQSYATLAWIPALPGDNHLLTVFKKNSANNWDSLYSVDLYNTTTYTVTGLQPTSKYKVEIRTKCSNGEPGNELSSVIPPQGLILELAANGRRPVDPKPVADCSYVSYVDPVNEWIGCKLSKITENGSTISSLFEFEKIEIGDAIARIKRVWTPSDILVAANQENQWPINQGDIRLTYFLEFNTGEIKNFLLDVFGAVAVDVITQPLNVSLCPNPNFPINTPYEFKFLVAGDVEPCPTCGPFGNNSGRAVKSKESNAIRAQSPFSDYMTIFFDEASFFSGIRKITLRDINGKIVFADKIDIAEPIISVPISKIPSGIYFLELISERDSQNAKLIKQ